MTPKPIIGFFKRIQLRFKRGFLTGFVVLLPLSLAILAIRIFIRNASPIGKFLITQVITRFNLPEMRFLTAMYPIMGLAFLLAFTWIIGIIASNYFGKKIVGIGENVLARIPLVSTIYFAAKQMLEAFTIDEAKAFRQVVLVEYPRKGLFSVGFITSDAPIGINQLKEDKLVNIFVPTTPNPTSGIFIIAEEHELIFLNISVEDGIKFIVSAGMITPKPLKSLNALLNP